MFDNSSTRATLLLLLVLPVAILAGCGEYLTENSSEEVHGVWAAQQGDVTRYIDISSHEFALYIGTHSTCFDRRPYQIVNTNGENYAISLPGTVSAEELIIRRSGERLEIRNSSDPNSGTFYNSSNEDVSALDPCAGGGADPIVVCTELPRIAVGETVVGSLDAADPTTYYWTYFDLYALHLTTRQQVTIDLGSTDIDSFLSVYAEDGALIAENDDTDTYDASLTLDLAPGCYRVEATSFDAEETGSYTLSVD